jgi:hypothetical protein
MRKLLSPKHWILQIAFLDGEIQNHRYFVTAQNIQQRAQYAASLDGIDVVLVLRGNADPDNPDPDKHIVTRLEPRPFSEYGATATKVRQHDRVLHTKTPGAAKTEQTPIARTTDVYTSLGRWS